MPHLVHVLTGPDAMDFLAVSWPRLYRSDGQATPFQSSAWLTGWAQQLSHDAMPMVLVAQSPTGRLSAALALALNPSPASAPSSVTGVDVLSSRGRISALSAPHAEYVRPVGPHAEDDSVGRAFVSCLAQLAHNGYQVDISDVPTSGALGRRLALVGTYGTRITAECAVVPLPLVIGGLSRATRKDHRRREREWDRLADEREVRYRRSRNLEELIADCDTLAALHTSRQVDRPALPGSPFSGDAELWRAVVTFCGPGHAFVATLSVDDVPVAAQLCLHRNGTAYSLAPAIDPAHKQLSPGHALLRYLTTDLACHGFTALDLGRTMPPQRAYKAQYGARWTTTLSLTGLRPSTRIEGHEPSSDGPAPSLATDPETLQKTAL